MELENFWFIDDEYEICSFCDVKIENGDCYEHMHKVYCPDCLQKKLEE